MPTDQEKLDALKALHAKATKGFWKAFQDGVSVTRDRPDEPNANWAFVCGPSAHVFCFEAAMHERGPNLESIAALHNDFPLLLRLAEQGLDAGERESKMRQALVKLAEEHENQADAWGGEEGDPDNSEYHGKLAKACRLALESDSLNKKGTDNE